MAFGDSWPLCTELGPWCPRQASQLVTPAYRWRLEASCLGALPTSPGLVGGYAQAFLAAPYMILKRAPGSTLSICRSGRQSGRYIPRLSAVAASGRSGGRDCRALRGGFGHLRVGGTARAGACRAGGRPGSAGARAGMGPSLDHAVEVRGRPGDVPRPRSCRDAAAGSPAGAPVLLANLAVPQAGIAVHGEHWPAPRVREPRRAGAAAGPGLRRRAGGGAVAAVPAGLHRG